MNLTDVIHAFRTRIVEADLKPGIVESIDRRYEFLEPIAASNHSGVVMKALDRTRDDLVAVRLFQTRSHACEPRHAVSLMRELLPTVHLRHPNIVTTHEIIQLGCYSYLIAMEYVKGAKLADLIVQDRAHFTQPMMLLVLGQLANALQHAHSLGMTCSHLRPTNVLLTADGVVKIADWGLTPRIDVAVPPECLAPECWLGGVDHRSDIYSLGMIGFLMATGRLAFTARSDVEAFARKTRDGVPSVQNNNTSFPSCFDRFILRCCAVAPEQRFQSMNDAIDEFARMSGQNYEEQNRPQYANDDEAERLH